MQFGANLVGHVFGVGELHGLHQVIDIDRLPGLMGAGGRLGDVFCDEVRRGAREVARWGQLVAQRIAGNVQRTGDVPGIQSPDHDRHQNRVLRAVTFGQHSGNPWGIVRQQLTLEFGLALL
ncbi:hypothetical protein D3C80_1861750 [compost metagenome]